MRICGATSSSSRKLPPRLIRIAAPEAVLADLRKDHPPADQLLQTFRDTLGGLRQFIEQNKIITIPSTVPPIVEETPPFRARPDHCFHGHARRLRDQGHGSHVQRHLAGA